MSSSSLLILPLLILPLLILPLLATISQAEVTLDTKPTTGESQLWSPLFQITWDKLQEQTNSTIIRVDPPNSIIDYLENFELDLPSVMPTDRHQTFGGPLTKAFIKDTVKKN